GHARPTICHRPRNCEPRRNRSPQQLPQGKRDHFPAALTPARIDAAAPSKARPRLFAAVNSPDAGDGAPLPRMMEPQPPAAWMIMSPPPSQPSQHAFGVNDGPVIGPVPSSVPYLDHFRERYWVRLA